MQHVCIQFCVHLVTDFAPISLRICAMEVPNAPEGIGFHLFRQIMIQHTPHDTKSRAKSTQPNAITAVASTRPALHPSPPAPPHSSNLRQNQQSVRASITPQLRQKKNNNETTPALRSPKVQRESDCHQQSRDDRAAALVLFTFLRKVNVLSTEIFPTRITCRL